MIEVFFKVRPNRLNFYLHLVDMNIGIDITSDSEFRCFFVSVLYPWVKRGKACPHIALGLTRKQWLMRQWSAS